VPESTPAITTGLFRLDADGTITLVGGRSRSSGRLHFPLAAVCPWTGADDVEPSDLPRRGRLWAWTTVTAPPPGYAGPVPYGFGVVEFDVPGEADGEVLRIVGRITVADADALSAGDPMVVVAEELPTDDGPVRTWAFAPDTGGDR
jgi:uncharacterized OB-fold protein